MNKYLISIEIPEGEVKQILNELTKAQEKIRDCYDRLDELGVVRVTAKEKGTNDGLMTL